MTEQWAQDCAGYEQRGAQQWVKAAIRYEDRRANGWSLDSIADEVTAAGFRISRETVRRRLTAVEAARATRARANSKAFLEAFEDAYAEANAHRGGQTPLDPETARRVYLEGVVGEWDRLFPEPVLSDEERPIVQAIYEKAGALLEGRRLKAV